MRTGMKKPTGQIADWLDTFCTGQPKIRTIAKAAARVFGVTTADILGEGRFAYMIRPRQTTIFLAVHKLNKASAFVGHYTNRDHTTVIHNANSLLEALTEGDEALAAKVARTWTLACEMEASMKPNSQDQMVAA